MNKVLAVNELIEAHIKLLLDSLKAGDTSVLKESREFLKQYGAELPNMGLANELAEWAKRNGDNSEEDMNLPFPSSKTGS